MKAVTLAPLLAGIGYALPQAAKSCHTVTEEVIVPTSTATYLSTHVSTVLATTAKDLGIYTWVENVSSTKTLQTLTQMETDCTATGEVTAQPTATVYTSNDDSALSSRDNDSGPSNYRRDDDCTITVKSTTTYGQTYTFAPAGKTSTYTRYTDFTQATVTRTSSGFTAYAVATALTTTPGACGPTVNATSPTSTATTTQDARCAPSALISAAGANEASTQFGLSYAQLTSSGATYSTNTTDASACCQQCAEAEKCAASAWDVRTGKCTLAFPVDFSSGELSCGTGLQVYYGAGPNHPMEPGSGLFVAEVCGKASFSNAKPDDGT